MASQRSGQRTGQRGACNAAVGAAWSVLAAGAGLPPPCAGLPAPWRCSYARRGARARTVIAVRQSPPLSAAWHAGPDTASARRATPPLRGCQATVILIPPPPQGGFAAERGTDRRVRKRALFPARRAERSRAAEPVKAEPSGWRKKRAPAWTELAALRPKVTAWPENSRGAPAKARPSMAGRGGAPGGRGATLQWPPQSAYPRSA
jgi:hypothetical protein